MDSQSSSNGIPSGMQRPNTPWGEYNNIAFAIQQALAKLQTSTLVRVEACTNNGGLSPVGFVDVTPLVNQLDSAGNPTPHVAIHNVPYFRLQGGANAVIIDPQPGDIGMACFASRDLSKVKSTKRQANPGSQRRFSFSDALYVGGMLNGAPTQYVQFSAAGVKIHSPVEVRLDAPNVQIECQTLVANASTSVTITTPTFTVNGNSELRGTLSQTGGGAATISGTLDVTGNIKSNADVKAGSISLNSHVHGGVQPGSGSTGGPV